MRNTERWSSYFARPKQPVVFGSFGVYLETEKTLKKLSFFFAKYEYD